MLAFCKLGIFPNLLMVIIPVFVHNVRSIKCILYTRLKKLKIVKLKKSLNRNVFGCLPSSELKKFGNIRNNLFVQTGVELLDHKSLNDPMLVECLC